MITITSNTTTTNDNNHNNDNNKYKNASILGIHYRGVQWEWVAVDWGSII